MVSAEMSSGLTIRTSFRGMDVSFTKIRIKQGLYHDTPAIQFSDYNKGTIGTLEFYFLKV